MGTDKWGPTPPKPDLQTEKGPRMSVNDAASSFTLIMCLIVVILYLFVLMCQFLCLCWGFLSFRDHFYVWALWVSETCEKSQPLLCLKYLLLILLIFLYVVPSYEPF